MEGSKTFRNETCRICERKIVFVSEVCLIRKFGKPHQSIKFRAVHDGEQQGLVTAKPRPTTKWALRRQLEDRCAAKDVVAA